MVWFNTTIESYYCFWLSSWLSYCLFLFVIDITGCNDIEKLSFICEDQWFERWCVTVFIFMSYSFKYRSRIHRWYCWSMVFIVINKNEVDRADQSFSSRKTNSWRINLVSLISSSNLFHYYYRIKSWLSLTRLFNILQLFFWMFMIYIPTIAQWIVSSIFIPPIK
jgi:hypothetical protein